MVAEFRFLDAYRRLLREQHRPGEGIARLIVDSKAIAIMIVGLGVILLIVSAAVGAPSDGAIESFSGWPVEAKAAAPVNASVPLKMAPTHGPLRNLPAAESGRDLSCTVAIKFAATQLMDHSYCMLTADSNAWRCAGNLVHNCSGDFPPADPPPADILETRGLKTGDRAVFFPS